MARWGQLLLQTVLVLSGVTHHVGVVDQRAMIFPNSAATGPPVLWTKMHVALRTNHDIAETRIVKSKIVKGI